VSAKLAVEAPILSKIKNGDVEWIDGDKPQKCSELQGVSTCRLGGRSGGLVDVP
jgi:hypothetical protein